ncbi:Dam family site-specific DNA-(adenine-N6)-methyltransferase [Providencia rettgeri]
MTNKTILKWAGSKVRIMEQLRPHLPKTKRLVEPFAGSCAVMMNTDYEQYLIADVNFDLINLYRHILDNPNDFIKYLYNLFIDANRENIFLKRKKDFNFKVSSSHPLFNLVNYYHAGLFLYLNQHSHKNSFNYSSKGEILSIFEKHRKPYFPEKEILNFIRKAGKANIVCIEWQDTLTLVDFNDGIYCDPPYMGKEFNQYYTTNFNNADHEALAITLKYINEQQGNPVTVSNSYAAKALYADLGFTIHEIDAPYFNPINKNRKKASEIIAVLK